MTIRIVTDSTCDLPPEVIEQFNIEVVPAYINIGEESYADGVDISHETFYANLATYSTHPSTAAPAPGIFADAYNKLAAEGATEIISLHVASGLSAFFNSATLGAADVVDGVTVHPIDSETVTMGLGLLVHFAARMIEAGHSAETIVEMVKERVPRTRVYAAVDTLEFLRKSGRISWGAAGFGTLLKIKPILEIKEGAATSFDRVRTSKKIPRKMLELLANMGELEELAILHIQSPGRAQELMSQMFGSFPADSAKLFASVGPTIGAHAGPGAIGFACITKNIPN